MTCEPKQAGRGKRRWFQFSLRSLLLAMLVFGCAFGWIAHERQRAWEGQQAFEAIRKAAAESRRDKSSTRPPWINAILGDDSYEYLDWILLGGPLVTDQTIKYLPHFRRAQHLFLSETQVTDAAWAVIVRLPELESLSIVVSNISDNGWPICQT